MSELPQFLAELLEARSPSGSEGPVHKVLEKFVAPAADAFSKDRLGNRLATLEGKGKPTVLLDGHIDELGLIIRHIDSDGFLYFDTIGGHDPIMIPGRRVVVLSRRGEVRGVTGKRAIHLMTKEERNKVPEVHKMWIDIGAENEKEARERVEVGDAVVYDHAYAPVHKSIYTSRAADNKTGCYVVNEVLRRLSEKKADLQARLVVVSAAQEEIGTRGAMGSAYGVDPDFGICVDVGHATDHPDCDARKHGKFKLGGGPILSRGPNINPLVFDRLERCAKEKDIPYQVEAEARPAPNDARAIQVTRAGVATGIVSLPLRYMHTPNELIDLNDLEASVRLIQAFVESLGEDETGEW